MENNLRFNNRPSLIVILAGLFCLTLLIYIIAVKMDQINCYKRFSSVLGVPSTLEAIYKALNTDLNSKLPMGLQHQQTMSTLSETWNNQVIWRRKSLTGGFKEYIQINYCIFAKNDFTFLFVYSEDNKLIQILNYIED